MKENLKRYIKLINKNINDDELLDFCIEETLDRTKLYLNRKELPTELERILAGAINNVLKDYTLQQQADPQYKIASMSDNGQSITYTTELISYFSNISDQDLFKGITPIINRYRIIKVVNPR